MMFRRLLICWITGVLFLSGAFSQDWNSDSLALSIPADVTASPEDFGLYLKNRFPDQTERVKALFSWLASHIIYDFNHIESLNRFESMDEFVLYTMKNEKAVCQGYAEVFTAVCNRMGVPAITVHGYNRIEGRLKNDLGHAWNVARIDDNWFLFDPTWGSGYVDNGRYHKRFDTFYFMTPPDSLIESHMPFDPIWQLRDYPITHDQFIDGGSHGTIYYNFSDSLILYCSQDEDERAEGTLKRAEGIHANREEIYRIYRNYYDYVVNIKCNIEITRYNESSTSLRDAIDRFNEFQEIRNRRDPDRQQQRALLEVAGSLVHQSLTIARGINTCPSLSRQEIQRLIRQISEVDDAVLCSLRSL